AQVELTRVERPEVEQLSAGLHEDVDQDLPGFAFRGAAKALGQRSADLLEARAGQALVQRDGHLEERLLRHLDREIDIRRADYAAADGGDQEHLARGRLDQLEALEDGVLEAGGHGDAGRVRDQAERLRRLYHEAFDGG